MKRLIFGFLAVSAMLCGCQKNDVREHVQDCEVLQATIEDVASTRTVMDEDNNIRWSEGDQVIAFMKSSYGHKYQLISSFAGKTYADFSIVSSGGGNLSAGTEWDHNVAYYPYSDAVEAEKSGDNYILDVVLPSDQTYAPDSFGNGAMAMVAVSEDNNFTFRNVLGGMKLQLKGTQAVTSITLQGNNNEKLSGAATVTAYTSETKPAITMASGASTSVTLECGSGVQLDENTATEFILALPPVTFSQGFTVTVTDSDGKTYTVETDKLNEVIRSSLLVMPPVTLDAPEEEEPEISGSDYVDEYGINHGQGVKIGDTVWAPVNCGYHATDFKYGKFYQWGRKYGQGYSGWDYNTSSDVSDATVPIIEEGGISLPGGQLESNSNIFYLTVSDNNYDWIYPPDDKLWNSGTESSPVKTYYDPCPNGWRVPTYAELNELCQNYSSSTTNDNGQNGIWFSGSSSYTDKVPQVFFPTAGVRNYDGSVTGGRGWIGGYWSSRPYSNNAYHLGFDSNASMSDFYRAYGFSVRCVEDENTTNNEEDLKPDENTYIPVLGVLISKTYLVLVEGDRVLLTAKILPIDATDKTVVWSSDSPSVVTVNQDGTVIATSTGEAIITASADGFKATCSVAVYSPAVAITNYVDEYGINHGKGIAIGRTVWAPVNCGYKGATSDDKGYPYGKLYQWGRKYGQGYSEYDDATVPTLLEGATSLIDGQSESNSNVFYLSFSDWVYPSDDKLWNSGTELSPVKTYYDPCPNGWRVPTETELKELSQNRSSWASKDNQLGYWFCGASSYTDKVPQVFFPAAGSRGISGDTYNRDNYGTYWSSLANYGFYACYLGFSGSDTGIWNHGFRAYGYSVRCVQE